MHKTVFLAPKTKKPYKPRNQPKKVDQKPVQKMPESYNLSGVVNFLLVLGLTSTNMWEKVMFDVRKKVSEVISSYITSLYFHLKMVSHSICTGIVTNSALSQHKLELISDIERDYDEIIACRAYIASLFKIHIFC